MVNDEEMVDLQAEALAAELKQKIQKEPGFAGTVQKAIIAFEGYERPSNEGLEHIQGHIGQRMKELYPDDPDKDQIQSVAGRLAILAWNGVEPGFFRKVIPPKNP